MEVDMFFFFLVFWSFGFRVGFHAPLLVARMGVLVCPCTFYAYRSLKTNTVVTILFQRHIHVFVPFAGYEPCYRSDGWTIHYIVALSERTSSAPFASAIVFPLRFLGAGFVCLVDAQVQPSHTVTERVMWILPPSSQAALTLAALFLLPSLILFRSLLRSASSTLHASSLHRLHHLLRPRYRDTTAVGVLWGGPYSAMLDITVGA
mmetsp:Transcript_30118/g.72772  ORF Transcript_30118/g.72772 Transcript_30118/m.72772 type:complete len:205 (+) Transcript_30118:877-1491(+)